MRTKFEQFNYQKPIDAVRPQNETSQLTFLTVKRFLPLFGKKRRVKLRTSFSTYCIPESAPGLSYKNLRDKRVETKGSELDEVH